MPRCSVRFEKIAQFIVIFYDQLHECAVGESMNAKRLRSTFASRASSRRNGNAPGNFGSNDAIASATLLSDVQTVRRIRPDGGHLRAE